MQRYAVLLLILTACPPDDEQEATCETLTSGTSVNRLYACPNAWKVKNEWEAPFVVIEGGPKQTIIGDDEYESYSDLRVRFDGQSAPSYLRDAFPQHIRERLDVINDATNCFFNAVNFHVPQTPDVIMKNTALATILDQHFVEVQPGDPIRYGDLLVLRAPQDTTRNYHHAAIILSKDYLLDKPNQYASPLRISTTETLFAEWRYSSDMWRCTSGERCLRLNVYRFTR